MGIFKHHISWQKRHPFPAPPPAAPLAPPAPWLQEHPGHPARLALQVELGPLDAANSAGPILAAKESVVIGLCELQKPFLICGYSWQLLSSWLDFRLAIRCLTVPSS